MKNLRSGNELVPKILWEKFDAILGIPHPSNYESELAEYIYQFGIDLGLESIIDDAGNVIIRKPASSEKFLNKKTVTLQAHIDMVPQKADNLEHDFEKDPIKAFVDGDFVTAENTTLGADNGIGIAAVMAILESGELEHGPLEALFTVTEETGMEGVRALNNDFLKGSILINLDSEVEGEIFTGCAGAVDTEIFFNYKKETIQINNPVAYKLKIEGLRGGHSGFNIGEGRANAIILMNRFLWDIKDDIDFEISEIKGGTFRNVIPSKCEVGIIIPKTDKSIFIDSIEKFRDTVKTEYQYNEPGLNISVVKIDIPEFCIDLITVNDFIRSVYACPNGALRMDDNIPGLVETSSNLGIIDTDDRSVKIITMQRSLINSGRDNAAYMVQAIFELAGADSIIHSGAYTGWKPDIDSSIVKTAQKTYKEIFGIEPELKAIHAGLECALIGEKYPEMEMISFGPTILDAHSINERVEIKSVEKFWDFLCDLLKSI